MLTRLVSGLLQVILGVMLAIALTIVGGLAAARYFMAIMTAPPPKPQFPAVEPLKPAPAASVAVPSEPADTQPEEPELPPGAYRAKVIWAEGLRLRESPSYEANSVGGVGYNETVYVIAESDDRLWQKIRSGSQEGWVKGGNLEKMPQRDGE